jgi:hypothetical protein
VKVEEFFSGGTRMRIDEPTWLADQFVGIYE